MSFPIEVAKRDASTLVQLFKFSRGASVFGYSTAGRSVVYGGVTYRYDTSLQMGTVRTQGNSGISDNIEVQVPASHAVAQIYRTFFPSTPIKLEIMLGFQDDLAQDFKITWVGYVISCSFSESAMAKSRTAKLVCEPRLAVLNRNGLPYRFGSTCQHSVYRGGCDLNMASHEFLCTVEAITGNNLTLSGIAGTGTEFNSGLLLFGEGDWRDVVGHSGSVVTINFPIDGLVMGSQVKVYRGCNKTLARCIELGNASKILKFDIPSKNMFDVGLN